MPPDNSGSLNPRVALRAWCLLLLLLCASAALLPPNTAEAALTLSKPPNNLGLVGYWSFNEDAGTIATDFSGDRNHGSMSGIANPPTAASGWTNGKRGTALRFDGTNDTVVVTDTNDSL